MDIAIIGMSGLFPDALNLEEFKKNLIAGKDSIKDVPPNRTNRNKLELSQFGYLDNIKEFDYKFFELSRAEAENMDPHHRILLQLVCGAIENAGYSIEQFRGTKTSVILSAFGGPKPEYAHLINNPHPTFLTGNAYSIASGRISHILGLRGTSMLIDTSCSSGLSAIHEACNKLRLDESDFVIAGGIRILANLEHKEQFEFIVEKKNGRCRTFDDSADGIVGGEGGGILLLKPLAKAIKDRDNIHAIIKGSAANQDGERSNGLAAPSPIAQTEVILEAWKKSKIDPRTIGYIEAHGTGTRLGDPIEVQAITDAFRQITDEKSFCKIGSLKTNIGHLGEAAGIASVIKTVLSLKTGLIFPSLHFSKPNKHIDFENSAVTVSDTLQQWNVENNQKRRAGVSAFSLSGTNVHLILEEYVAEKEPKIQTNLEPMLFTISAKSQKSFNNNKKNLLAYLRNTPDCELENVSYVLNNGRSHYQYRYACIASSLDELIADLSEAKLDYAVEQKSQKPIYFIFPNDFDATVDIKVALERLNILLKFSENSMNLLKVNSDNIIIKRFINLLYHYSYWNALKIKPSKLLGTGIGNIAIDLISNNIHVKEAIEKCLSMKSSFDEMQFVNYIKIENQKESPIIISMSSSGEMLDSIEKLISAGESLLLFAASTERNSKELLGTLAVIYECGIKIDWNNYYQNQNLVKIDLPTYSFDQVECWIESFNDKSPYTEILNESLIEVDSYFDIETTKIDTLELVSSIWKEAFKLEDLDVDSDFFDIGGNSLMAIHIQGLIEEQLNIKLDYDIIFEHSTLGEFSNLVDSLKAKVENESFIVTKIDTLELVSSIWKEAFKLEDLDVDSDFFDIGGNSLMAIHIQGLIEEQLNIKLDYDIIFEHSTLGEFSNLVDSLKAKVENENFIVTKPELLDTNSNRLLSFSEEGIWYMQQLNPENSFYNVPLCFRIKEKLNLLIFEKSVKELIQRHESFRTLYQIEDGKPKAVVQPTSSFKLELYGFEDYVDGNMLLGIREKVFFEPFRLNEGSLLRISIAKLGQDYYEVLICMHHIISDDWSMQIFMNELSEIYNTLCARNTLMLSDEGQKYRDYASRQRKSFASEQLRNEIEYWSEKIKGGPELLQLQMGIERPAVQSFKGGIYRFDFANDLTQKLIDYSKSNNLTLFMTLFAGWNALLYKYTGSNDIVVGIPVAGRTNDSSNIIGNFVNSIAVRVNFSDDVTFKELSLQVRNELLDSFKHMHVPFNLVVESLNIKRQLGYTPVYQNMFDFHHNAIAKDNLFKGYTEISLESQVNTVRTDIEMMITLEKNNQLQGYILYNTDIYSEEKMIELASNYMKFSQAQLENINVPIIDIVVQSNSILDESEIETSVLADNFDF